MQLLVQRASMTGFLVFDYTERYPEARAEMAQWLKNGELKSREDVVRGDVRDFPEVFLRLFRGENIGKLVLELPT
jgi:NADPH-dependent curcumin reductase CurA